MIAIAIAHKKDSTYTKPAERSSPVITNIMYELEKRFIFEAGHVLSGHDGKCREPHGHSYTLAVIIKSERLIPSGPKKNMVIDFSDISAIVKPMIEKYFDHKWLNTTLECDSATVEFIAKWIFDYLAPLLPGLYAITIYETATSKVSYFGAEKAMDGEAGKTKN